MAWNPSPEVAAAREAARAIGAAHGIPVKVCVVTFTTEDDELGYASYGKTRELCDQAKRLADELHQTAYDFYVENP